MLVKQDVGIRTLDGLTLRGWLYPAEARGPAVIMTPGFNITKDLLLPDIAEAFQQGNITALLYDPRSIGASDGSPRNEVDPAKQVEDYSDALTFLIGQPTVDPSKVGVWGMSVGAMVAACAAALDKRIKFTIMVSPLVRMYDPEIMRKVLRKSMKDREAQTKGNPPFMLAILNNAGINPVGMNFGGGLEALGLLNRLAAQSQGHETHTTLQSYYRLAMWQPHALLSMIAPTPVLVVVPEEDMVSPATDQLTLFDSLGSPKQKFVAPGKGHFNVLIGRDGADGERLQALQEEFVRNALAGRVIDEDADE